MWVEFAHKKGKEEINSAHSYVGSTCQRLSFVRIRCSGWLWMYGYSLGSIPNWHPVLVGCSHCHNCLPIDACSMSMGGVWGAKPKLWMFRGLLGSGMLHSDEAIHSPHTGFIVTHHPASIQSDIHSIPVLPLLPPVAHPWCQQGALEKLPHGVVPAWHQHSSL